MDDLEREPLTCGRLDVAEVQAAAAEGRDLFAERVEARIVELLAKYDCALVVSEAHWVAGMFRGKIDVVRRSASPNPS